MSNDPRRRTEARNIVGGLTFYRAERTRLIVFNFMIFLADLDVVTVDDAIDAMEYNPRNGLVPVVL